MKQEPDCKMNLKDQETIKYIQTQLESGKCVNAPIVSGVTNVSDIIQKDQHTIIDCSHSSGTKSPDYGESMLIESSVEDFDDSNQWYSRNRRLYALEVEAMTRLYPNARMGFLENGSMYWVVRLSLDIDSKKQGNWTLLAVYDKDHPSMQFGGSVNIYPILPNYEEMLQMVNNSCFSTRKVRYIPNTLRDGLGQYFSLNIPSDALRLFSRQTRILTAAGYVRYAETWIKRFNSALTNSESWNQFFRKYSDND